MIYVTLTRKYFWCGALDQKKVLHDTLFLRKSKSQFIEQHKRKNNNKSNITRGSTKCEGAHYYLFEI